MSYKAPYPLERCVRMSDKEWDALIDQRRRKELAKKRIALGRKYSADKRLAVSRARAEIAKMLRGQGEKISIISLIMSRHEHTIINYLKGKYDSNRI